jgi:hypothetical protein
LVRFSRINQKSDHEILGAELCFAAGHPGQATVYAVLSSGGKNKCVELSAQVIFKARFFFSKFNYGVTNQARCRLAITIVSTSEI